MRHAIIVSVLVAVFGTAANAAVIHPHILSKKAHVGVTKRLVRSPARHHYVRLQPPADYGQLIGFMFGAAQQYEMEIPRHRLGKVRVSRRRVAEPDPSSSYDASPTTDTSSSSGADGSAAAIQSANDQSALDASVAAAQQQNEAAQAAAQQTENNANNN